MYLAVTSLVAPDGQATDLSIGSSNNLDSVYYENNTQFNFYYDGALLTEKEDRNGHTYSQAKLDIHFSGHSKPYKFTPNSVVKFSVPLQSGAGHPHTTLAQ